VVIFSEIKESTPHKAPKGKKRRRPNLVKEGGDTSKLPSEIASTVGSSEGGENCLTGANGDHVDEDIAALGDGLSIASHSPPLKKAKCSPEEGYAAGETGSAPTKVELILKHEIEETPSGLGQEMVMSSTLNASGETYASIGSFSVTKKEPDQLGDGAGICGGCGASTEVTPDDSASAVRGDQQGPSLENSGGKTVLKFRKSPCAQAVGDDTDPCHVTMAPASDTVGGISEEDDGECVAAPVKESYVSPHDERIDALLEEIQNLALPGNPLDTLIDEFGGPACVCEMTGRASRLVRDAATGKITWESRSKNGVSLEMQNTHEKDSFMKGEKLVAIISEAASSGISLQADRRAVNQR